MTGRPEVSFYGNREEWNRLLAIMSNDDLLRMATGHPVQLGDIGKDTPETAIRAEVLIRMTAANLKSECVNTYHKIKEWMNSHGIVTSASNMELWALINEAIIEGTNERLQKIQMRNKRNGGQEAVHGVLVRGTGIMETKTPYKG